MSSRGSALMGRLESFSMDILKQEAEQKSTTKAKKSDEKEHLQDCEIYCRAIQDGGAAGVPAGSVYGRRA